MSECQDASCVQECEYQFPDGVPVWEEFESCVYSSCGYECANYNCGLSAGDQQCDNCLSFSCGAQCESCTTNNDCIDWLVCTQECYDQACLDECSAQYPGGEMLLNDLMQCVEVWCSDECGYY